MRERLLDLDLPRLVDRLAELGEPAFRARQLWRALHRRRAASFEAMSDLGAPLRARLAELFTPRALVEEEVREAADGLTVRRLFRAPSGAPGEPEGTAETVLIRERREKRRTVCLSCMSGCPIGCAFCATGQGGFDRDLTRGEMLEQVYRMIAPLGPDEPLTHVVFMGMGEPLLNLDAVLDTARTLTDPEGLGLGARRITISTIGVPTGIRRLAAERAAFRLAVSLHAPTQALRERLIPTARRWPLSDLVPALREFARDAKRELTFEYCLIHRVNSAKSHAIELADLLRGLRGKVNLIPLNPTAGFEGVPPPPDSVRAFRDALESRGVPATIRVEKGGDIDAACGQLRGRRA